MTPDDMNIQLIAEVVAKATVEQTLTTLGIDVNNPIKAQQDFMILREVGKLVMDSEFRKDMDHLRAWRLAIKDVKSTSFVTLIGIISTGIIALILADIKGWFKLL